MYRKHNAEEITPFLFLFHTTKVFTFLPYAKSQFFHTFFNAFYDPFWWYIQHKCTLIKGRSDCLSLTNAFSRQMFLDSQKIGNVTWCQMVDYLRRKNVCVVLMHPIHQTLHHVTFTFFKESRNISLADNKWWDLLFISVCWVHSKLIITNDSSLGICLSRSNKLNTIGKIETYM